MLPTAVSDSLPRILSASFPVQAGAVRTVLSEAALTMHPLVHAQRSAAAGLCAAGVFALGGYLDREQQRQQRRCKSARSGRSSWAWQMAAEAGRDSVGKAPTAVAAPISIVQPTGRPPQHLLCLLPLLALF